MVGVVDEVQHGDRDDEGEIEPVRHVDVRLLALDQRAEEHQQVDDPDDGEPQIGVPLGLGVLLALGDAEQVAGAGDGDEQLVAPDHEPGRPAAGEARVASALHDIERGGEQHVAAKGEDHGGGVQRAQAAEAGPGQVEVQRGEGQLPGDEVADDEAGDAPDHGGNRGNLDRTVHVVVRSLERAPSIERLVQDHDRGDPARRQKQQAVKGHSGIVRPDEHE